MGYNGRRPLEDAAALGVRTPRRRTTVAGEAPIKQAVKWIEDQLRDNPGADRVKLVDAASRRFDLSPLAADFLFRHLAERATKK